MACRPINSLASDRTTSLLSTAITWWLGDQVMTATIMLLLTLHKGILSNTYSLHKQWYIQPSWLSASMILTVISSCIMNYWRFWPSRFYNHQSEKKGTQFQERHVHPLHALSLRRFNLNIPSHSKKYHYISTCLISIRLGHVLNLYQHGKKMCCHFHEFHGYVVITNKQWLTYINIQFNHRLLASMYPSSHGPFPSLAPTFHQRLRQQASSNAQDLQLPRSWNRTSMGHFP